MLYTLYFREGDFHSYQTTLDCLWSKYLFLCWTKPKIKMQFSRNFFSIYVEAYLHFWHFFSTHFLNHEFLIIKWMCLLPEFLKYKNACRKKKSTKTQNLYKRGWPGSLLRCLHPSNSRLSFRYFYSYFSFFWSTGSPFNLIEEITLLSHLLSFFSLFSGPFFIHIQFTDSNVVFFLNF